MTEWKYLPGVGSGGKTYKLDGKKIVIPDHNANLTKVNADKNKSAYPALNLTKTLTENIDEDPQLKKLYDNESTDIFRHFLGLEWQNTFLLFSDFNNPAPGKYQQLSYGDPFSYSFKEKLYPEAFIDTTTPIEVSKEGTHFGVWRQRIRAHVNMADVHPYPGTEAKLWRFLHGLTIPANTYIDSTFFIDRPSVNRIEKISSNYKPNPSFVETTPSYNYYFCKYEEKIAAEADEHLLPSVYNIASISNWNADPDSPPPEFVKTHQKYNAFGSANSLTEDDLTFHNLSKYLMEWPMAIDKDPHSEEQSDLHRHVLFPPSKQDFFESVEHHAAEFPMHMKISFSPTPGTGFVDMLNKTNFFKPLVKNIFNAEHQLGELLGPTFTAANPEKETEWNLALQDNEKYWKMDQALGKSALISDWSNHALKPASMQYFGLSQWIDEMNSISDVTDFKDFLYPYAATLEAAVEAVSGEDARNYFAKQSDTPLSIFEAPAEVENNNLLQIIFFKIAQKEINEYAKEHMRTYEQILKGEPAHNETIMYELVKLDKDLKKIQTVFFPQTSGIIEYFDTQVKYGKEYIYQIYAHQLVVGTKYKYFGVTDDPEAFYDLDFPDWAVQSFQIDVEYEPDLKIYRVPYYNTEDYQWKRPASVTDSAPLPPEVVFYPLAGKKNKVTLALNTSIGRRKMEPTFLSSEESANFGNSPSLQKQFSMHGDGLYGHGHAIYNYPPESGVHDQTSTVGDLFADKSQNDPSREFIYSSDDTGGTFEIYRMDEKPGFYTDFEPLSKTLVAKMDSKKQSAFTDESIQPNRKYYYTCRLRDPHGNLSNPTPVYEVELIDTGLGVYPSIKTVELKGLKKVETEPTSPFRRFLLIRPNYIQDLIEGVAPSGEPIEEAFPNAIIGSNAIEIGQAETSVFNKKFKARITSKRTGRKLDFNFSVKSSATKLIVEESKEKC